MSTLGLILRGLIHHRRSNLTVAVGVALAAAIMVGALAVGGSVRRSLEAIALSRLGGVEQALVGNDRWFRAALADEVGAPGGPNAVAVPVMVLRGIVTGVGSQRRVNGIDVIGVDARFARLWNAEGEGRAPFAMPAADSAMLNEKLAEDLGVGAGDTILLYVENPDRIPSDAPLSRTEDPAVAARLTVSTAAPPERFGDFSLQAGQVPPRNVFVPLEWLQKQIARPERANLMLTSGVGTSEELESSLAAAWKLDDAQLKWRRDDSTTSTPVYPLELRSDRIFMDDAVARACDSLDPPPLAVFTYFVNELRVGERSVPYSMVSGLGFVAENAFTPSLPAPLPPAIEPGTVVINQWLADQLQAKPGDALEMKYFVIGRQRRLEEKSRRFTIRAIVPIEGLAADASLMPDFPGLSGVDDCINWEPGIPIDTGRIRPEDEAYWDDHAGTPKAFISLGDAREIWTNRFGSLTALRFRDGAVGGENAVERALRTNLKPSDFGLFFVDIRDRTLRAGNPTTDFGGLFGGFSFFLIFSAVLLSGLLFILGIDQRQREFGALRAVGWTQRGVRRLALAEGLFVAAIGVGVGTLVGQLYTRLMIHGLNTIWHDAVRTNRLAYHADSALVAGGAIGTLLVILATIWMMLRCQSRRPLHELLQAVPRESDLSPRRRGRWTPIAMVIGFGGALVCVFVGRGGSPAAAAMFFFAGFLMLFGCLSAVAVVLRRLGRGGGGDALTLSGLALRSTTRRAGRSLATVILLCLGTFLVVAVGANRRDPAADALKRSSGAGGFQFYGVATIPIPEDLNSTDGREAYGIDDDQYSGVRFVALRTSDGEEASCLNLIRVQRPRVLGVNPASLDALGAFGFARLAKDGDPDHPWSALNARLDDGSIPAIVDQNTAMWSLGLGLGDTLALTDDRGREVQLKFVGLLKASILQGSVIVGEDAFERHFPSVSGYKTFLLDAPSERTAALEPDLERRFERMGLDLTPTVRRLAEFQSVENTYLSIFLLLGGLGLALGCVGLGVVLMRNLVERREELSLLRAIGFSRRRVHWLIFLEHLWLLAIGLLTGLGSAVVAVWPTVQSRLGEMALGSIAGMLLLILVCGLVGIWLAAWLAMRGAIVRALQSE
jgi:ABC-type antimicrobial peptide transport system permease subunit